MTISDEAKQAAILIARDFGDIELLRSNQQMDRLGESIQQAIDLHERDLLGQDMPSMTAKEYVSVLKDDSAAFEKLHAYVTERFGVKGNHSVYEDLDCAKAELNRLTKLNAELLTYTQHIRTCRGYGHSTTRATLKFCDCGLAQLLERMK